MGFLKQTNLQDTFVNAQSDYAAANEGRFKRRRNNTGGTGDDHYQNERKFLKVIEDLRDMDRNDAVVGMMADRFVDNAIQNGAQVDPQTGDDSVNAQLKGLWNDWAGDANKCDTSGRFKFWQIERFASRSSIIDGDMVIGGVEGGRLEMMEADRLLTPQSVRNKNRKRSQVIHGVEINNKRRPLRYWMTKSQTRFQPKNLSDMIRWNARDEDGNQQVFHIGYFKRPTQARGVSPFLPVIDVLGMFEDIQFAKLVQAQVVSCMAIFLQRMEGAKRGSGKPQFGNQTHKTNDDGTPFIQEEVTPGGIIPLPDGMEAKGFSPNVPNAEFFQHVKLILTLVGNAIGLPLVTSLMDASETNFSGWRGAVDEARRGYMRVQEERFAQFNEPAYLMRVRQELKTDSALRKAFVQLKQKLFKHKWNAPNWPYMQPEKDAKSNQVRIAARQTSPRRLQAEIGNDQDEIQAEIVADNAQIIRTAILAKQELQTEFPNEEFDYRDLINLDVGIAKNSDDDENERRENVNQ